MADAKVSALAAMTTPAGTEKLYIVDGSTSKHITAANVKVYCSAAPTLVGDVTLSTGDLIMGTSGKGISFAATADLAGKTLEILDDYEEGTWTMTFASGLTSVTYTGQTGFYVKIGNLVTVGGQMIWTAATDAGTAVTITLPFTSSSSLGNGGQGTLSIGSCALPSGYEAPFCGVPSDSAVLSLYGQGSSVCTSLNGTQLTTAGNLSFNLTYYTA